MNWISWTGWSGVQGIASLLGLITVIAFIADETHRRRIILSPDIEARTCGSWTKTGPDGECVASGDSIRIENVGGTTASVELLALYKCDFADGLPRDWPDVLPPGKSYDFNVQSIEADSKINVGWISHLDKRILVFETMRITRRTQKQLLPQRRTTLRKAWSLLCGRWWYRKGDESRIGEDWTVLRVRLDRPPYPECLENIGSALDSSGFHSVDVFSIVPPSLRYADICEAETPATQDR